MKKVAMITLVLTVLTSCGGADESCGCSDQDLQDYAQSMNVTIDEAKEECCRLQKIADEMNAENK
jgi:hypothetical protein